jgi:hypothetical protein
MDFLEFLADSQYSLEPDEEGGFGNAVDIPTSYLEEVGEAAAASNRMALASRIKRVIESR